MLDMPEAEKWGWKLQDDKLSPIWMCLAETSKSCRELIKCNCKSACSGRCKCRQQSLHCTELCQCGGECIDKNN